VATALLALATVYPEWGIPPVPLFFTIVYAAFVLVGYTYLVLAVEKACLEKWETALREADESDGGGAVVKYADPTPSPQRTVTATWAFAPRSPDELAVGRNEALAVVPSTPKSAEPGWLRCRRADGAEGLVPSNYVK
jgi:hypothetical protein